MKEAGTIVGIGKKQVFMRLISRELKVERSYEPPTLRLKIYKFKFSSTNLKEGTRITHRY